MLFVAFKGSAGKQLNVFERDIDFEDVMSQLASQFPGLERWREVLAGEPFPIKFMTLWHRGHRREVGKSELH